MAEIPRKTSFAVTCGLLSRHIKEKGSVPELGLGTSTGIQDAAKGKSESFRPPTTMRLLPGADVSSGVDDERETDGEDISQAGNAMELFPQVAGLGTHVREQEKAQLTIFYGGKVLVFDKFPAEKANDLMQLASKATSTAQHLGYVSLSSTTPVRGLPHQDSTLVLKSANTSLVPRGHLPKPAQPYLSDLPIARRASLHRFLEKRRDRINGRAPYQASASADMGIHVKQEDSNSWLGLATRFFSPTSA